MQKPSRSSKIFIALLFLFVIVATLLAAASVNLLVIVVLSKLYPDDVSVGGAMSGMVFSIGMLFIFRLFILAGSLFELGTQIWFKRSLFWRGLVNAGLCYGFTWLYIILPCKKWTETVLPKLDQDYIQSGKAAVYVLDYPFLGPDSNLAALAGETLYQQNHEFFETYHKLMMEKQKNEKSNWATKDFLLNLVKEGIPGADLQQFEKDLDAGTYLQQMKKDKEIGKRLAIPGTPTIYVNGLPAENADYETVKALIEQELAK
ncbi:putative disulfide bond formation protein [Paenibacillus larvae subsp. larvae DSM 25430]|uniref:DsbA family protein n=1 Tax=Paenibacillus larvae TaxID=1464 RepID=UPI00040403A3|nr:thioredoxin domain-containing protein [Paenibacillus larvae]AVG12031.1 putative disulfide bond formation protein [Paenibacillus larvae subsp. larvae DSM 25430]